MSSPTSLSFSDAFVDLAFGSHCVGCSAPGRMLCRACTTASARGAFRAVPSPEPAGLGPVWAAGAYDGALRRAVAVHKEEAAFGLAGPLADRLSEAVRAVLGPARARVVLVPVPSRPGVARQRADEPMLRLVRLAARRLRAGGVSARAVRLLRSRGGVLDQAGLGAAQRHANLAWSLHCHAPALRSLARAPVPPWVVVCDDVVTTGATLVEARRALSACGVPVLGAAVVAAVARNRAGPGGLLTSRPEAG